MQRTGKRTEADVALSGATEKIQVLRVSGGY